MPRGLAFFALGAVVGVAGSFGLMGAYYHSPDLVGVSLLTIVLGGLVLVPILFGLAEGGC